MHYQYLKIISQPTDYNKNYYRHYEKKNRQYQKKIFTVLDGMQWRQNWLWWLALGTTMQRKLRKD